MQTSNAGKHTYNPVVADVTFLNGYMPSSNKDGHYKICSQMIEVTPKNTPDFLDITNAVKKVVDQAGIREGNVLIYSLHTTAAIIINENEPLLIKDLSNSLYKWVPKDCYYGHNDFTIRTVNMHEGECPNGHSHCQHILLGTSETVPVISGQMLLGEFQSIFLVELDEPKERKICIQVQGI